MILILRFSVKNYSLKLMKNTKSIMVKFLKTNMAPSSKSVRTSAFHAGNPGSNPGGVTIILNKEDLPMIVLAKSNSEDNPPERMGS